MPIRVSSPIGRAFSISESTTNQAIDNLIERLYNVVYGAMKAPHLSEVSTTHLPLLTNRADKRINNIQEKWHLVWRDGTQFVRKHFGSISSFRTK